MEYWQQKKMRKQQKNKKFLLTSHLGVIISRVVTDELPALFVRGGMVAGGYPHPRIFCELPL